MNFLETTVASTPQRDEALVQVAPVAEAAVASLCSDMSTCLSQAASSRNAVLSEVGAGAGAGAEEVHSRCSQGSSEGVDYSTDSDTVVSEEIENMSTGQIDCLCSTASTAAAGLIEDASCSENEFAAPAYVAGTFEGPEKTMEVQFIKGVGTQPEGLRSLTRQQLDRICSAARCSIVSSISNSHCDAYVLSESSLFVYRHKLVMKTCGTTTLLRCIGTILGYADEMGMELTWLGYSRKNLFRPNAQQWPHSSFGDEMKYLDTHEKLQTRLRGHGYIMGPLTGDHWYVYVVNHEPAQGVPPVIYNSHSPPLSEGTGYLPGFGPSPSSKMPMHNERTVNLMMFDMAPSVARLFFLANTPEGGAEMTRVSGISQLCPGATIDETHFTPCGYSMNAILHDTYYTIHVTPEPECSYVSFETNAVMSSYNALVRNVLRVFKPKRFLITTFGDEEALRGLKALPTDSRYIDTGMGVYHRHERASACMDAASNADMIGMMANYTVDPKTVQGWYHEEELPASVPPAEFPNGFRQQRPRGQSLGLFA